MKDFYAVLGVPATATQDEIKAAYRGLARQWHPDIKPEPEKKAAEEKFKEIAEAYETLGDANKRSEYDQRGKNPFADMFQHFNVRRHPRDTIGTIEIDLIEASLGSKRKITIEHEIPCEKCEGTGSSTKKKRVCGRCKGAGQLSMNHGNNAFMFTQHVICPACQGQKEVPESACPDCSGKAERTVMDTLELSIPAGVDNRHVLVASKMGRNGGDLKIYIIVRRHPKFERQNNDLLCSMEIPFRIALLGGRVHTTGLHEEPIEFEVPRGSQYDAEIVIKGKGICGGDLRTKVYFSIPCLPDDLASQVSALLPT